MGRKSAAEIAKKQIDRSLAAGEDYRKGIERTAVNPMEEAKKKKAKFKNNINRAIDNGDWERGLDSVSKEEWSRLSVAKGVPNYTTGIEAAKDDIAAFHEEQQSFLDGHMARINAMPTDTLEQSIAKSAEMQRTMAKFKRTRRRR